MATATRNTRKEIQITHVEVPAGVTLELTEAEASFLRAIIGQRIAGPMEGPRVYSTAIFAAMDRAGITSMPMNVTVRGDAFDPILFITAKE